MRFEFNKWRRGCGRVTAASRGQSWFPRRGHPDSHYPYGMNLTLYQAGAMDFLAACVWGGITVREGLGLLRALRGLEFVAFDINTVSPPHDHLGITGSLAAQVAMECLFLLDTQSPQG